MQWHVCFNSEARGRKNVYISWSISHICYTHMFTVLHHTLSPRGPGPLLGERRTRGKEIVSEKEESDQKPVLAPLPCPSRTSSVWALGGWIDRRFLDLEEEEWPAGVVTEWYCELTD